MFNVEEDLQKLIGECKNTSSLTSREAGSISGQMVKKMSPYEL